MTALTLGVSTPAPPIKCTRCSKSFDSSHRAESHNWLTFPPIVVQGIQLGMCPQCRVSGGPALTEVTETPCDGTCNGRFKDDTRAYYVGVWGDDGFPGASKRQWSCWDMECVKQWIAEQDYQCETCGHMDVDMSLFIVRDGKPSRVMS